MKTAEEVRETEVLPEVDDFRFAQLIVSEQHCIGKVARMWYMARWVARLREHYVALGQQVGKPID